MEHVLLLPHRVNLQTVELETAQGHLTAGSRILVAADFKANSAGAIVYAALLSKRLRAPIDVLYVWDPRASVSQGGAGHALFADTPEGGAMARCLSELQHKNGVDAHGRLAFGDRCAAIVNVVQEERFDLIVMGIDERPRVHPGKRPLARCVASKVTCPVIAVRPDPKYSVG